MAMMKAKIENLLASETLLLNELTDYANEAKLKVLSSTSVESSETWAKEFRKREIDVLISQTKIKTLKEILAL